jgi:dynein heavy chain, axonemal
MLELIEFRDTGIFILQGRNVEEI